MKRIFYSAIVNLLFLSDVLTGSLDISDTCFITHLINSDNKYFEMKIETFYPNFKSANLETFVQDKDVHSVSRKRKNSQTIPVALNATYADCETTTGSDKAVFFLATIDKAINAGASSVTVSYHNTLNDANLAINLLISPYLSASKTIYARVTDTADLAYNISTVELIVKRLPIVAITGDDIVCGGTPLKLSVTGTYFGEASFFSAVWSFVNGSDYKIASIDSLGRVSGKTGGSATVKCGLQDTKGCTNVATKLITVTPTLKTVTAARAICSRDSAVLKLTGLTPNNIFSLVYNINSLTKFDTVRNIISDIAGNAQFKAPLFSINNQPIPPDRQYLFIDRVTDAHGCTVVFDKQAGIIVYPLPVPNFSGASIVCSGSDITMQSSYNLPAGTSFDSDFWSSSNPNVATVINGIVTGISAGNVAISYRVRDSRGCDSTMNKTITVLKSLTPTINISASATTICTGIPVNFSATIMDGGTIPIYVWQKNNNIVGTNASNYIDSSIRNNDTILCALQSNVGCTLSKNAVSNTIKMSVNANPIPTIGGLKKSYFKNEPDILLTAEPSGGRFKVDSVVTASLKPAVLFEGNHIIRYDYKDVNGCAGSQIFMVDILEALKSGYAIYPNPTDYEINLKVGADASEKIQVQVTDMAGYILKTENILLKAGDNLKSIYVEELMPGIYFVILKNENQKIKTVLRFSKQ